VNYIDRIGGGKTMKQIITLMFKKIT